MLRPRPVKYQADAKAFLVPVKEAFHVDYVRHKWMR
jgi:hypothetical protein